MLSILLSQNPAPQYHYTTLDCYVYIYTTVDHNKMYISQSEHVFNHSKATSHRKPYQPVLRSLSEGSAAADA